MCSDTTASAPRSAASTYASSTCCGVGRDVVTWPCPRRAAATSAGSTSTPSAYALPPTTTRSGTTRTPASRASATDREAVESVTTATGMTARLPSRSRTARTRLSAVASQRRRRRPRVLSAGDDVDELRRPDDDRAHAPPVEGGGNLRARQGKLAQVLLADARRHLEPVADPSLHLHHTGHGLVDDTQLAGLLVDDVAPQTLQEPQGPHHGPGLPRPRYVQRSHRHLVDAERVSAEGVVHLVRRDDVIEGLPHLPVLAGDRLAVPGPAVPVRHDLGRRHGLSSVVAVRVRLDVALVVQPPERLLACHMAQVEQDLVPEAGVEQVQHGVLDPADVQV